MEDLDLYRDLGIFANRVLKEGGSLVTFIGQFALIEIGKLAQNEGRGEVNFHIDVAGSTDLAYF